MRSGDSLRRDVLRMAANAGYNLEKTRARPLTDDEWLEVLAREVKTRRESIDAFRMGGREDLATKEEAEVAILLQFLPEPLSEAALAALIEEAVTATGASSSRDMGKVMGWLSPRTRNRADGKQLSERVSRRLASGT